jgi:hypothetical protein
VQIVPSSTANVKYVTITNEADEILIAPIRIGHMHMNATKTTRALKSNSHSLCFHGYVNVIQASTDEHS